VEFLIFHNHTSSLRGTLKMIEHGSLYRTMPLSSTFTRLSDPSPPNSAATFRKRDSRVVYTYSNPTVTETSQLYADACP
jgi:hypothetical protein